jgi:CHAT domain-containing protein/tetratricopeptide (TPR) repeat protein
LSSELAQRLINAESPEAFLRDESAQAGWRTLAALKTEVDRLVGCDLNRATRLTERVEQLSELVGDPLARAFAEASRARLLHLLGHHGQASVLYEKAVGAMRAARLSTEAAIIQKQQVDALTHAGRYDDALRVARAARRALRAGEPVQLAQLEVNVGNVYYLLDRYKKALEHYDKAHQILSVSGDETMRAVVDGNRSNILTELDRPDEALALLESAASAFDRTGQALYAAQTRFHMAYLHFLRGNYNTALASYYQVRDRLSELGSLHLVAWCNLEIAEILLALNAFDDAAESAAAARERFTELGMPYESARSALAHALALAGLGRLDEARGDLLTARDAFASNRNSTFTALADAYLAELAIRSDDPAEAASRAASSLRTFARQKLANKAAYSRLLVARAAYRGGDRAKAARLARGALVAAEKIFSPAVAYQSHHLLGRIERDRKRNRPALESFQCAIEIVEKLRGAIAADDFKATFLRDKVEVYEDAIAACLDEGSEPLIEEALRLVESSKSRALADLLARYVRDAGEQAAPAGVRLKSEARERLSKLIADLNWYSSQAGLEDEKGDQRKAETASRYRRELVRCERQIAQLFRRLESEGSEFAEIQRMRPATASDLRGALESDEVAIEYFTTGDEVSAFVATRDGVRLARGIASRREVERALAALRFQIEKFNYGAHYVEAHFGQLKRSIDDHLARLHGLLFAPLEAMIKSARLVIIPHGALHYVPFHALRGGTEYLVDRFEVSYSPSAAVLKLCRARQRAQASKLKSQTAKSMVALGVAESGTPNIEDEIEALGSIFPDAVRLTGERATRANLMEAAPAARFLHLASHGFFRRDNPMFSFLKLADSHLNFYSLLDLRLNAEMVTLSACHTGVNTVFPGDELHGLMRGFLYAGAPSLVVSLWAVSDGSTASLMREMYSNIRAGDTKRRALRRAQLAIKDAYGHPYYWAPFVLMGDHG